MSQPLLPQRSDGDDVPKTDTTDTATSKAWLGVFWSRNGKYRPLGQPDINPPDAKPKSEWLPRLRRWRNPDAPEGEEWIQGGRICTLAATVILCLNTILFIVALVMGRFQTQGNRDYASMPIYRGDCTISSRWATGLHLFINIVSTCLLAACNFVMQCLGAPSREDISMAHRRRKWLDIGTYSIRNFAWMDNKRKLLWVILLVTSLPIHLLYNSVVYSSISSYAFGTIVLPVDLARGEPLADDELTSNIIKNYLGYSVSDLQAQLFDGTFHDLDAEKCIEAYAVELNTDRSTLVLVADRKHFHTSSIFRTIGTREPWQDGVDIDGYPYLCDMEDGIYFESEHCSKKVLMDRAKNHTWAVSAQPWTYPNFTFSIPESQSSQQFGCDSMTWWESPMYDFQSQLCSYIGQENPTPDEVVSYLTTSSNWNSTLVAIAAKVTLGSHSRIDLDDEYSLPMAIEHVIPITGCKSKSLRETCQLNFSWPVSFVVLICNSIKVICMYLATRKKRKNILLTVGDAISTFLTNPDATTQGRCMMTRASLWSSWVHERDSPDQSMALQDLKNREGYTPPSDVSAGSHISYPDILPSSCRWWSAVGWKRWAIVISLFLVCLAVSIWLLILSFVSGLWTEGIGKPSNNAMITLDTTDVLKLSLLSNTPQIVLSMLYYIYNSALTCMVVGAEYISFALERKPLRVSWPRGAQRSTYYLSLPYRYSIPFIAVSTTLHWLLSQSIFLVQVQEYNTHGDLVSSSKGCGYSNIPILITMLLGSVATGILLGIGIRRYKSQMPLAGHCSAAISAACHPPKDDVDAALNPVMWGEVSPPTSSSSSSRSSSPSSPSRLPTARNSPQGLENGLEYAHCTFTSQEVTTPVNIRLYA